MGACASMTIPRSGCFMCRVRMDSVLIATCDINMTAASLPIPPQKKLSPLEVILEHVSPAGPTLAEGELLIMAVRTPRAWMVILSLPFFQTYTPTRRQEKMNTNTKRDETRRAAKTTPSEEEKQLESCTKVSKRWHFALNEKSRVKKSSSSRTCRSW